MEQLNALVQEAWEIPYVRAAVAIVAAIAAAKIIDIVICHSVLILAKRTRTELDDEIVEILHRPIFLSVAMVGFYIAMEILAVSEPYRFILLGILKTIVVILWTVTGFRVIRILLEGLSRAAERISWIEARTVPLLDNLGKLLILGLGLYLLLVSWRLDVTPWLASAGVAGIAIGFAAKDTLANLFGGIFIVADAPYKLGDYILLDTGERGMVTKIGLRSTRLLTRDDIEITLPNAQIASSKIVNESGGPWEKARVTVTVGVAYGSDVDQVRRVLLESAAAVTHVVDDPEPRVRFTEFGDSALIFRLLCWIREPSLRGLALDEVNTAVYKNFHAEGIQIPFPQRDVHMKQPV